MEDRQAYYGKIEGELMKWEEEIKRLKEGIGEVDPGMETQYYEQIEDLEAMHELAGQRLRDLREFGDDKWEGLKTAMENALISISKSHALLMSHFR